MLERGPNGCCFNARTLRPDGHTPYRNPAAQQAPDL